MGSTGHTLTRECILTDIFEQQVQKTPEAVAVRFEDRQLTYLELNARANRLAHYLIQCGVGPEDLVAISLPRSPEMIIGILGILKAGAAYVPLDPDYPEQRLLSMMQHAKPSCLVSTSEIELRLPECPHTVFWDRPDVVAALDQSPARNPTDCDRRLSLTAQNAAYVIYTSGSTGIPKGVLSSHGGVTSLIAATIRHFVMTPDSRVLQLASFSFDAAFSELTRTVASGATLVMVCNEERSPAALFKTVEKYEITHVSMPPSLLATLPQDLALGADTLVVAGEGCSIDLAARWAPGRRMINVYGVTESTVCSTISEPLTGRELPSIGKPIWNTQVFVLDGHLEPVPIGVTGELYIAGIGLARGYLNAPGLTAERFIAHPYSEPGRRIYRTGDLVRWRKDATLEFIGRADEQVKLRGVRVELGEVEAALRAQPEVAEAVAVVREDKAGEKTLVAYVVATRTGVDGDGIRQQLRHTLPEYLVPAAIVPLQQLPLTVNGKLDRKALPAPDYASKKEFHEARTPEEEVLCGIFAEVLGVERVGLDDNFFEMGGHSLMATRVVSRIRGALGRDAGVATLFDWPTVRRLGPLLREQGRPRLLLQRQERPARVPLSYAQQRLWFIDQLEETSAEYNMPAGLRLKGELDWEALERALETIVERHESLRTRFEAVDGEPMQVIEPAMRVEVPVEDLSGLPEQEQVELVLEAMRRERKEAFDLTRGPVWRVKLLRLGDEDHMLLRTMHHIVSDGWSEGVFNREFRLLYEAYREGRENPLQPLTVQYADYTLWQRAWLDEGRLADEMEYWKRQLAGIPEWLELPTDRARPAMQTFEADVYRATLTAEQTEGLKRVSRKNQATLYMTLLAALAVLLSRYSGQEDVVVGSPIANREDERLEEMIGLFVNKLVMRVRIRGEMSFTDLVRDVRRTALEAYEHQDMPFERIVEELSPERSLSRTPIFQVSFQLQNAPRVIPELEKIEVTRVVINELLVRHDLEILASEREGTIAIRWMYRRDLFDMSRIAQMATHYVRVLEAMLKDEDQ